VITAAARAKKQPQNVVDRRDEPDGEILFGLQCIYFFSLSFDVDCKNSKTDALNARGFSRLER
jgi:hypothetical protein